MGARDAYATLLSHAMAAAKIHAPSAARVAEARRTGLRPRTLVAAFAAAWLALVVYARLAGEGLWQAFRGLLQRPLEAAARGELVHAPELAWTALREIALHVALLFAVMAVCMALVLWLAQGPHFALPARGRRRFDAASPSFATRLLASLVPCALFAAFLSPAFWLELEGAALLLSRFVSSALVALSLLAVIDVATARTAFLRALWMTRQELKQEQREAYGSPELRALRDRVRRESARGVAGEASS